MLERFAYKKLLDWKKTNAKAAQKKALLVSGARQIGKTFLIEQFAKKEYAHYIKIDFTEDETAIERFAQVKNSNDAFELLSLYNSLYNNQNFNAAQTLIFLDEVQECKNLITFSKYLVQDGRFDLIMSGSVLGIELGHVKSLPVGYMSIFDMHPLSFYEYCLANNLPNTVFEHLEECYTTRTPVKDVVHEKMIEMFRRYLLIGGMPDVINRSLEAKGDLATVREVQQDLLRIYKEDISKYSSRSLQIKKIFNELPAQLNKENKRFQLNSLAKSGRYEKYEQDFSWLADANVALKANRVTDPKLMLSRTQDFSRFKLYSSDVGLLMSQYTAQAAMDVLSGQRAVNFGAVYENYFAQELICAGADLYYYNNNRRGEVDFLLESEHGYVVPIEIKSGKSYKLHVALNNLLTDKQYSLPYGIVLSEANVSVHEVSASAHHKNNGEHPSSKGKGKDKDKHSNNDGEHPSDNDEHTNNKGIIYYMPLYMSYFIVKEHVLPPKKAHSDEFVFTPIDWSEVL